MYYICSTYPLFVLHCLSPHSVITNQHIFLHLSVLFLAVSGWLMAVLLKWMFSPARGKSNCSYSLSEYNICMTKRDMDHVVSQTKFCRTPGQSTLKSIEPGSWESHVPIHMLPNLDQTAHSCRVCHLFSCKLHLFLFLSSWLMCAWSDKLVVGYCRVVYRVTTTVPTYV